MGILVMRISSTAKKVGQYTVHFATSAYKPTGRKQDEEWHRLYVAPSERAWAKKSVEEQTNVLVAIGSKLIDGAEVYLIPKVDGSRAFVDDMFGDEYKAVGVVCVDRTGKFFIRHHTLGFQPG